MRANVWIDDLGEAQWFDRKKYASAYRVSVTKGDGVYRAREPVRFEDIDREVEVMAGDCEIYQILPDGSERRVLV